MPGGLEPEINSPEETPSTPEKASIVHSENQAAGMGEAIRRTPCLGVTALTKHLVT